MTTDLSQFGHRVRQRREELGLTQLQVAAQGGPSNTTQTKVENGEPPPPIPSTLRKIDSGLRWLQGSARALLVDGAEPIESPILVAEKRHHKPETDLDDFDQAPKDRGRSTLATRFRNVDGGVTELAFDTHELLDAMRRGAQPISDFTSEELLMELVRRFRELEVATGDQATAANEIPFDIRRSPTPPE